MDGHYDVIIIGTGAGGGTLARQPDRHLLNRQAGHPGLGRSTTWTDTTT